VGFRPFVYRAAQRLALTGSVCNRGAAVVIEAQGGSDALDALEWELEHQHPPLARIDAIECAAIDARDEACFTIDASAATDTPADDVTIDSAVCDDCLAEMRDARDRRHGYALINCTNCGPRYSIIRGVPYDRPNTTMAGFALCDACRAQYTDPADRRFHAQPTACPDCGPLLELADPQGDALPGDPLAQAAALLRDGRIVLIKGLGGFHLACRADDEVAVARLRRLKRRDAKPFALMVRDTDAALRLAEVGDAAVRLLASPRRPIVLAPRRAGARVAPSVAPGCHRLGVMLPYTPIHHLLFDALGDVPLVMTSANVSDEPLVIDNAEAVSRVGGMCDAICWHDRPIERAVDDSVLLDRGFGRGPLPVRRARGYVPEPITLPIPAAEPGLCVGGELKNTVAVVRGGRVILSHHLGDLKHPMALDAFGKAIDDLCALFDVSPRWIAHDLHPAYLSTAHARALAQRLGVPLVAVQHHHAHAAALLAEHQRTDPILALACDGVGHGPDGTSWGGELLLATPASCQRLARLRPLDLPGGDAAARDTRRSALALLAQAYGPDLFSLPALARLLPDIPERRVLAAMVSRGVRCASSSGLGRVFDGIAALLGLCMHNGHEAQAAMQLESAAAPVPRVVGHAGSPGFELTRIDTPDGPLTQIDLSPTTRAIVVGAAQGTPTAHLAALFHDNLARALAHAAIDAAGAHGLRAVGLTGGCFLNARLADHVTGLLDAAGLEVLQHAAVPPGDGGVALGQALVAAARLWQSEHGCHTLSRSAAEGKVCDHLSPRHTLPFGSRCGTPKHAEGGL